jgi:hypothetical protein
MPDETCRCEVLDPITDGGGTDPRSCPVHAYEAGRRHERNVYLEERAALVAERDRLATDSGIKSILLEQVADGTLAPTRDAIQARHDELWEEARNRPAKSG